MPQAAHEFITLLDVEQQKRIFIILAFAIYKEISKKDWYPITFVHKEGKLVSMCGDGKHLFYFYPSDNKEEMLFTSTFCIFSCEIKSENW